MTFIEAMYAAKNGKRVRRADWVTESYVHVLVDGYMEAVGNHGYLYDYVVNIKDLDAEWEEYT